MRLLQYNSDGDFSLTKDFVSGKIPEYAILSHTWGADTEEVTYRDLIDGTGKSKVGYEKIRFCGEQARHDGFPYFWVDTCCIDKSNHSELAEAINSMFRWYRDAAKCYVFMSDVSITKQKAGILLPEFNWEPAFRASRWFTRGWTLQELLGPSLVEFFSQEGQKLGDKRSLERQVQEITRIALLALRGAPLSQFGVDERLSWARWRQTARQEDEAYSLLGIFGVHMPLLYGEGRDNAFIRLRDEIDKPLKRLDRLSDTVKTNNQLHMFFVVDYQAILSQIPNRFPNTCYWILETNAFKKWARGEGSSVFWLCGYPGLGKSVISKYVVEEGFGAEWTGSSLRDSYREAPIIIFFFCSYRDSQTRSLKNLLSSLLHQLLYQEPKLWRGIRKRYDVLSQLIVESVWSLWGMLEDVIFEILKLYPTPLTTEGAFASPPKTLYIVVDALDELYKTEWGPLCDRFFDILKRSQNVVRLFITSRKEPDIEQKLATAWCLELSSTSQNASDVAEYLRTSVSTYGKENNFGDEVNHTITSEITKRAQGMFLWASLAWSHFTEGVGSWTRAIIQQRLQDLQHLPPGMESLYQRILASVDCQNHAELLLALQWIVATVRPLTIDEIAISLALRERPRKNKDIDTRLNIQAFFRRRCPHLVKINENGTITLVHLSFRDYLLQTLEINNGTERIPNTFHIDWTEANFEIGLDCLSYIALDDFANEPLAVIKNKNYKFFSYAYHNWIGHLTGKNDRSHEIWVFLIKLIDPMTKLLRWYDTSYVIISLWRHGLSRLFKPAVEFGMDLNVVDTHGDHFIHIVVSEADQFPLESLKFLTSLGLSINGRTHLGQTLLHRCISEWQDEMTSLPGSAEDQVYFDNQDGENNVSSDRGTSEPCSTERTLYDLLSLPGIDPNAMDKFGYTPLSFAIHEGLDRVVAILLACPQLDIVRGFAALHIAAKEGVVPAVETLLSRGVSVSEKTKYGETALHLAASSGHLRVLKLLASKSLIHVLNAKDHNGWTVVHRAVTSGNIELVLWLIEDPNINLNLRDKHGRRATEFAAAYGTETMLKVFLERRPDDIMHSDSFGNTLFHMAVKGSNQQNLSFLHSLYQKGHVARPGANKWGWTVVDLALISDIKKYLLGLGFAHSERYLSYCEEISMVNLREMEKRAVPTGSNSGMELRDLTLRERNGSTSSKPDRLGWRFNSIYAID